MANDRHLNRLNEKAEDAGSYLATIHIEVRALLGDDYYERQARSELQNLEENFHKMLKHYRYICLSLHITGPSVCVSISPVILSVDVTGTSVCVSMSPVILSVHITGTYCLSISRVRLSVCPYHRFVEVSVCPYL